MDLENGFGRSLCWLDFYDQSVSIHILFLTLDLYRLLIHKSISYFMSVKVAYFETSKLVSFFYSEYN